MGVYLAALTPRPPDGSLSLWVFTVVQPNVIGNPAPNACRTWLNPPEQLYQSYRKQTFAPYKR